MMRVHRTVFRQGVCQDILRRFSFAMSEVQTKQLASRGLKRRARNSGVATMDECKERCASTEECSGIEYNVARQILSVFSGPWNRRFEKRVGGWC